MNQEQVKDKLLMINSEVSDFTVTFSGKSSKKVDGLYYPDRKEIVIHNKNFADDNQLIYTAIHEFAHHVHFMKSSAPVSSRSHTIVFYDIFHKLLYRAEELKIYRNIFETIEEFRTLTEKIKRDYLTKNGQLMKDFGSLLMQARELCRKYNVSFEDYVDRALSLHRNEAKTIMKTFVMDINPEIGYENMKTVAKIRDEDLRKGVEEAFFDNKTVDMIRAEIRPEKEFESRLAFLEEEKRKIEDTLNKLTERLVKIERDMDSLRKSVY